MVFKIFLLLHLTGLLVAQTVPDIFCEVDAEYDDYCYIGNVNLPREIPEYRIRFNRPDDVREVEIYDSRVAVITNEFCRTFSYQLFGFRAISQGVEVLTDDAFNHCRILTYINLDGNLLKTLPGHLFESSIFVGVLHFSENQLTSIPVTLFEDVLFMSYVYFDNNQLTRFPFEALEPTKDDLQILDLASNDIVDLEEDRIAREFPKIGAINFSDNLVPCSRIEGIFSKFAEVNIKVYTEVWNPRNRTQRTSTVRDVICVL